MTLSVDARATTATDDVAALQEEIRALARQRNAVILAHNYQRPEVQDLADFVGDSLGLSREAASTDADVIVFCGVHFMAETAAILSPRKTVLLPDLAAGCSLASTIDAEQLRAVEGRASGRRRRVVREHDRRGEGGKRLLLHLGERGRDHQRHSARARHPLSPRHVPRRARAAGERTGEHPRLDGRVSRARRDRSRSTSRGSAPRIPAPSSSSTPSAAARRAWWRQSRRAISTPKGCRSSAPKE